MQVTREEHRIGALDGTSLHVSDYLLPASSGRGSVVIMHGIGEHSGRYQHVARFFNACGLSVRCYDHRGHGLSRGARGDVSGGDPMLGDAKVVIDEFAARFSEPPFLFGHSMGGLFAARFTLERRSPLRGLMLSSPALAISLSGAQLMLLKVMHALAPWLAVPNGLSPQYLSHDAAVVAAYQSDPLVHGKISPRLLRSMLDSIEYCQAHAAVLATPTLMVIAGDDHLVDAEGSRRFFAQVPNGIAQLKVYPDFYHEIFNEPDATLPFEDVRAWLGRQCLR